jgi:hypothetical protein
MAFVCSIVRSFIAFYWHLFVISSIESARNARAMRTIVTIRIGFPMCRETFIRSTSDLSSSSCVAHHCSLKQGETEKKEQ